MEFSPNKPTVFNPLESVPAPGLGEMLTRMFANQEIVLDAGLAALRPDLWGHKARLHVECLRDLPADFTIADLVRQIKTPDGAKKLGIVCTLCTEDGQVARESDSMYSLLSRLGFFRLAE